MVCFVMAFFEILQISIATDYIPTSQVFFSEKAVNPLKRQWLTNFISSSKSYNVTD